MILASSLMNPMGSLGCVFTNCLSEFTSSLLLVYLMSVRSFCLSSFLNFRLHCLMLGSLVLHLCINR